MERKSKYNVDTTAVGKGKRTYNGIVFASKLEMEFYRDWVIPKIKLGEIIKCERQVKYELQPSFESKGKKYRSINYVSDFDITFKDGSFKVIDTKGMLKPEDKIKEKLFRYRYPDIEFIFIGKSNMDGGFVPLETIIKNRKLRKQERKSGFEKNK